MIIIWIIVSIIMFSIIILIHEWWHFASARKFWVKVEEFWLWIPPRAKKLFVDKKWTLFSLNWLPIGWFVRLYWEHPELLKNINDKKALFNKPIWQQSIIILAWVFMNFILASFIFSIMFMIWIKPIWINTKIETNARSHLIPTYEQSIKIWLLIKNDWIKINPVEWSIASKYWILQNDILLWEKNIKDLIKKISNNPDKEIIFDIKRWKQNIKINIIPENVNWKWKIWAYLWENIKLNWDFKYKYWFFDSITYWIKETFNLSILTFKWIKLLFVNIFTPETPEHRTEAIKQVKWPIWIVDFISNSMQNGISFILIIWAIISINLWVFNLLPIPALDGWRFILIIINWIIAKIFWKKIISTKLEAIIHAIFFIILILVSIIIAYNDIINITNK